MIDRKLKRFEARRPAENGLFIRMIKLIDIKDLIEIPFNIIREDFKEEGFEYPIETKIEWAYGEPGGIDNEWLPWQSEAERNLNNES